MAVETEIKEIMARRRNSNNGVISKKRKRDEMKGVMKKRRGVSIAMLIEKWRKSR